MAGRAADYIIGILVKMTGDENVRRKLGQVGDAVSGMNDKVTSSAQAAARLFQNLGASVGRFAASIPSNFGGLATELAAIRGVAASAAGGIASLGTALAPVGVALGGLRTFAVGAAGALGTLLTPMMGAVVSLGIMLNAILLAKKAFEGLKAAVQAAADTQESVIKLGNALRTMGAFSDRAVNSATSFANALQATTKYSDEEILSTQALLAQLGGLTAKGLERATKATLDLASGLGRDLPVAALIMAKAAQGSTWELRKYGLVIDENIPRTQRWAAALEFVERKFGGRAEAELKGLTASIRQFAGAWQDTLSTIGQPFVLPLAEELAKINKRVLEFNAIVQSGTRNKLLVDSTQLMPTVRRIGTLRAAIIFGREEAKKPWNWNLKNDIEKQARDVERTILDLRAKLSGRIIETTQTSDMMEVLDEENFMLKRSVRALKELNEFRAAHVDELKNETQATAQLRAQEVKLQQDYVEILRTLQELRGGISRRLADDTFRAGANLKAAVRTIKQETASLKDEFKFKADIQVQDIAQLLEEKLSRGEIQRVLARMPPLDFKVEELKLEWNEAVASKSIEKMKAVKQTIRDQFVGLQFEIVGDRPAAILQARELWKFMQETLAQEGPLAIQMVMEQESVRQVLQTAKNVRSTMAMAGEQIQLFDPRTKEDAKSLTQALDVLEKELLALDDSDPKKMILTWNSAMERMASINFPEEAGVNAEKWIDGITAKMLPRIEAAREKLRAQLAAGDLEVNFRLALHAKDFDLARKLLDEFTSKVALLGENDQVTFRLKIQAMTTDLDAAIKKAENLDRQINESQAIFSLAVDLKNFDLAQEQIDKLQGILQQMESDPIEIRLALQGFGLTEEQVTKLQGILQQAANDPVTVKMELQNFGLTEEQITKIQGILQDMEDDPTKIKLMLEIQKMRADLKDAQIIVNEFLVNMQQEYQNTLNNIIQLPISGISDVFGEMITAMVEGSADGTQRVIDSFKHMVESILKEVIKLIIVKAIINAITGGGAALSPSMTAISNVPFLSKGRVPERLQSPFGEAGIAATERVAQRPSMRRKVEVNVTTLDTSTMTRELLYGDLGRTLARVMK